MDFLPDCMTPFQEEAFSAVNADMFTKADIMAIDFTALFALVDPQILAADNTCLFELGGNNGCMGCLAAAGSQQTLGPGNFLDVFRYRILADQDQGAIGVFPAYLVNIFTGEDGAARQGTAADTDTLTQEIIFKGFRIFKNKKILLLLDGDHIPGLQDIENRGRRAFKGKFNLLRIPAVLIH